MAPRATIQGAPLAFDAAPNTRSLRWGSTLACSAASMRLYLVAIVFALSACGWRETDMVRARAATQFRCDEHAVQVRETREVDEDETHYEASGCDKIAEYQCTKTTEASDRPARRSPRPVTVGGDAPTDTNPAP